MEIVEDSGFGKPVELDSDYVKLVRTIDGMQRLVEEAEADARNTWMLYGEQCKEVVEEFKHVRDNMPVCPGGESSPILGELSRMACGANSLLEGCIFKNQTSWLQAALVQNDKTVFTSIVDGLKWGFLIFLEVENLSTPEPRTCKGKDKRSPFIRDREHLEGKLQRLVEGERVSELDQLIATFLLARLNNPEVSKFFAERVVSGELWDPSNFDNNFLGCGSFGTVHTTKWLEIKLARKKFTCEISRDCPEIAAMAGLNHHNVVRFISSSTGPGNPAIIMECMEMTLTEYLEERKKQNSEGQGAGWLIRLTAPPFGGAPGQIMIDVDIMYQIASGMAYLHEKPHMVAHRDLKPCNILINKCKLGELAGYVHAKIADMGLSKMGIADDVPRRNSHENTGSRLHRAPEMYHEGTSVLPKKADIYSFGIICWEILHVQKSPCLEGVHRKDYGPAVKRGIRPEIDSAVCPGYLGKLIKECWQTDPCRRPSFSTCSLALQSYKAKLLGSKSSLVDFTVPTFESRAERLWRNFLLHVPQFGH